MRDRANKKNEAKLRAYLEKVNKAPVVSTHKKPPLVTAKDGKK